jgi:hypothetical protein
MKRMVRGNIDDVAILNQIAQDPARHLRRYLQHVPDIIAKYQLYVDAAGNAADPQAPLPLHLPEDLKTLLKGYYARPPEELAFIESVRESSTDACPMCGGGNCSTIDHIFPKGDFAEFSFFSWNLVPACGCNVKRRSALRGNQQGERVLHPYFDACLTDRLIRAQISANHNDFTTPKIELLVLMDSTHPNHAALQFHLKEIVLKTYIKRHWIQLWGKLRRGPEKVFTTLQAGDITLDQMSEAVTRKLQETDYLSGTPNNWDSMLYAGLAANADAKEFLLLRVRSLRAQGVRSAPD